MDLRIQQPSVACDAASSSNSKADANIDGRVHDITDHRYYWQPWERDLMKLEQDFAEQVRLYNMRAARLMQPHRISRVMVESVDDAQDDDEEESSISDIEFEILKDFYGVKTKREMERKVASWGEVSASGCSSQTTTPTSNENDQEPRRRAPLRRGMHWLGKKTKPLRKRLSKRAQELSKSAQELGAKILALLKKLFARRQLQVSSANLSDDNDEEDASSATSGSPTEASDHETMGSFTPLLSKMDAICEPETFEDYIILCLS